MLNMRIAALSVGLAAATVALSLAAPTAVRAQSFTASANLFGTNEVPSNTSSGAGAGVVSFDGVGTLTYSLSFVNLTSNVTAANIQVGAVGVNGPAIFQPLQLTATPNTFGGFSGTLTASNFIASPSNGINTFTDALNAIRAGNTYLNIDSRNFPNGEIRGQLLVPVVAPEPGSLSLMALAAVSAGGFGLRRRFRRRVS